MLKIRAVKILQKFVLWGSGKLEGGPHRRDCAGFGRAGLPNGRFETTIVLPLTDSTREAPYRRMNLRNWILNALDAPRRRKAVREVATLHRHVVDYKKSFLRLRENHTSLLDCLASFEREGATPQQVRDCLIGAGGLAQLAQLARRLNDEGLFDFEIKSILKLHRTAENEAFVKSVSLCAQKLKKRVEILLAEASRYNDAGGLRLAGLLSRIFALRTWHKMTGVEFENYIINKLRQQGFLAIGTKASGDEGIDIIATWQSNQTEAGLLIANPVRGRKYLIQCKRYDAQHAIGQPILREFFGSIKGADPSAEGILITTSCFSEPAVSYALKMGIRLIDGKALDVLLSTQSSDGPH